RTTRIGGVGTSAKGSCTSHNRYPTPDGRGRSAKRHLTPRTQGQHARASQNIGGGKEMTYRLKCGGTLSFVAAVLAATLITSTARVWAQEFPTKPVRMIVPFAPGGGSDLNARRLSDQLS